jgi:tetratricopeptide (TPR) repeat protein
MRRYVGYVLLGLFLVPAGVQAQNRPSNSMHTRSAEIYLDRANSAAGNDERDDLLSKALEVLWEGAENDPSNPRIWFMAGQAYARMGDVAGADSSFDRAQQLYPEYVEEIAPERLNLWITSYNEGVASLQSGDPGAAMAQFEMADQVYRGRPEAVLMLGSLRAQSGDLPGAEEAYRTALDITTGPAAENVDEADRAEWVENEQTAADRLARLLSQLGRTDEAIEIYRSAVERHPDNHALKADLAAQLAAAGQIEDASAMYEELLATDDLSDVTWFNAGVRLYSADQPVLAAQAFRKSVEINPYSRDGWYNYGQALYAVSNAIETEKAAAAEADQASFNDRLEEVNEQLLETATRIRELDPAFRGALMMQAQAMRTLGELAGDEAATTSFQQRVVATLEEAEAMPFEISGIQSLVGPEGDVTISGRLTNHSLTAGQTVTLEFSVIGEDGETIGSRSVEVTAGEADAESSFEFELPTDASVLGWKYTITS